MVINKLQLNLLEPKLGFVCVIVAFMKKIDIYESIALVKSVLRSVFDYCFFVLFVFIALSSDLYGAKTQKNLVKCKSSATPQFLNKTEWHKLLGQKWQSAFRYVGLNSKSNILEIGPGIHPKIANALVSLNFKGNIYLNDLNVKSLELAAEEYQKLLPNAKIHIIPGRLVDQKGILENLNVDFLVGNHILDDMIAGQVLLKKGFGFPKISEKELSTFLSDVISSSSSQQLKEALALTRKELRGIVDLVSPKNIIFNHYRSIWHSEKSPLEKIDLLSTELLEDSNASVYAGYLRASEFELNMGKHNSHSEAWRFYSKKTPIESLVLSPPEAIQRLGNETFVPVPLKQLAPENLDLLYFNKELAKELGIDPTRTSTEQILQSFGKIVVEPRNKKKSKNEIQDKEFLAWADRQSELAPFGMNGNYGSGRAVYYGQNFNIKGVGRTPLVGVPEADSHGNGKLELAEGIWETFVSNILKSEIENSSSPVLALIYMKSESRALLVRVDKGSLDRPSHSLYKKQSNQDEIKNFVYNIARLEAQKFNQRLVHGAWSSSNVSKEGHFIDLDTFSAQAERGPRASFISKFIDNYFGQEGSAQKKIAGYLAEFSDKNLSSQEIERWYDEAYYESLEMDFLYLAGLSPKVQKKLALKLPNEIKYLVENYRALATLIFPDLRATDANPENSQSRTVVFAFSNFLRQFPYFLNKNYQKQELIQIGLGLLRKNPANFQIHENPWASKEVNLLLIKKFSVYSAEELLIREDQAKKWISSFVDIFSRMRDLGFEVDYNQVFKQAYIVNENRGYAQDFEGWKAMAGLSKDVENSKIKPNRVNAIIQNLIDSSKRIVPNNNVFETDKIVFKNAMFFRRFIFDGKSYSFKYVLSGLSSKKSSFYMDINGFPVRFLKNRQAEYESEKTFDVTDVLFRDRDIVALYKESPRLKNVSGEMIQRKTFPTKESKQVRIAMAQIDTTVEDFAYNVKRIKNALDKAKQEKANMVVFSELVVSAYNPKDRLSYSGFLNRNSDAVERIQEILKSDPDYPSIVVIGSIERNPDDFGKPIRNVAMVFKNGEWVNSQAKRLLPDYGPFNDTRHFAPGEKSEIIEVEDFKIGCLVCEDIWAKERVDGRLLYKEDPIQDLGDSDFILHLEASPYEIYKLAKRDKVKSEAAQRVNKAVISVNQFGAQDHLLYDGASSIYDGLGRLIYRMPSFEEAVGIVDFSTEGVGKVVSTKTYQWNWGKYRWDQLSYDFHRDHYKDSIAVLERALIRGIQSYMYKIDYDRVVIGMSGGVDSSNLAPLLVKALGRENVIGVLMPSKRNDKDSIKDAEEVCKALGIECIVDTITDSAEIIHQEFQQNSKNINLSTAQEDTTHGNEHARLRMIKLNQYANKFDAVAAVTSNMSEHALGQVTAFGDGAGGIAPVANLYKQAIYLFARYQNSKQKEDYIPNNVFVKPAEGQLPGATTDVEKFGEWQDVDRVLNLYINHRLEPEKIQEYTGLELSYIEKTIKIVDLNEFKRFISTVSFKLDEVSFTDERQEPITKFSRPVLDLDAYINSGKFKAPISK